MALLAGRAFSTSHRVTRAAVALTHLALALATCPNAAPDWNATLSTFDARVRRDYVGQAEPRRIARESLYRFFGRTRSTCGERVLHFTGPSGSGKSFLAQITAEAIFDAWEYELYPSMTYGDDCTAAHAYDVRSFRARRSFPSQCGVNQHKFSAATTERAVELWGQRVAETLLSDGSAVVIVDDVLRIDDQAALDRLGELICPSGDGIPAFKTAEGEEAKAARALFILTSDLEPPQGGERHLACDAAHTWAEVVAAVGRQQDDFWRTSGLRRPEWWSRVGLVPFRELCPAELSEATRKCAAQFFGAQFFGAQFFGGGFGAQFGRRRIVRHAIAQVRRAAARRGDGDGRRRPAAAAIVGADELAVRADGALAPVGRCDRVWRAISRGARSVLSLIHI